MGGVASPGRRKRQASSSIKHSTVLIPAPTYPSGLLKAWQHSPSLGGGSDLDATPRNDSRYPSVPTMTTASSTPLAHKKAGCRCSGGAATSWVPGVEKRQAMLAGMRCGKDLPAVLRWIFEGTARSVQVANRVEHLMSRLRCHAHSKEAILHRRHSSWFHSRRPRARWWPLAMRLAVARIYPVSDLRGLTSVLQYDSLA